VSEDSPGGYAAALPRWLRSACRTWRCAEERRRCSKSAPALRPLGHHPTLQAVRGALYQRRSGFAPNIDPAQNRQLLADVLARTADSTSPHQTEAALSCLVVVVPPVPLHELAPDLYLARAGLGRTLNVYLFGTVVLDSGVCWSRPLLARQLAGRQVTAHVLTHALFDHAGCSAWLCETLDVPLWCGAGDAEAIATGAVDTHRAAWFRRSTRILFPVRAHDVTRTLREGDVIDGFEVLEVPGHSRGALAFWRARDHVLICGDVLANFGLHPKRPRLVLTPAALSWDLWRTDVRHNGWPSCGHGWPASVTASPSPTPESSRPPSAMSWHPNSVGNGYFTRPPHRRCRAWGDRSGAAASTRSSPGRRGKCLGSRRSHWPSGNRRRFRLRLWTQIVGKVWPASTAPLNHWWHFPLYLDVRGLTTRRVHAPRALSFEIDAIASILSVIRGHSWPSTAVTKTGHQRRAHGPDPACTAHPKPAKASGVADMRCGGVCGAGVIALRRSGSRFGQPHSHVAPSWPLWGASLQMARCL
jgi:hydroxyacylglutathione hydrolase